MGQAPGDRLSGDCAGRGVRHVRSGEGAGEVACRVPGATFRCCAVPPTCHRWTLPSGWSRLWKPRCRWDGCCCRSSLGSLQGWLATWRSVDRPASLRSARLRKCWPADEVSSSVARQVRDSARRCRAAGTPPRTHKLSFCGPDQSKDIHGQVGAGSAVQSPLRQDAGVRQFVERHDGGRSTDSEQAHHGSCRQDRVFLQDAEYPGGGRVGPRSLAQIVLPPPHRHVLLPPCRSSPKLPANRWQVSLRPELSAKRPEVTPGLRPVPQD